MTTDTHDTLTQTIDLLAVLSLAVAGMKDDLAFADEESYFCGFQQLFWQAIDNLKKIQAEL